MPRANKSTDPRPGDSISITREESIWTKLPATVRNVYRQKGGIVISAVVHPKDANTYMLNNVPRAPDGGFHIMLTDDEFEITKRTTYA